MAFDAGTIIARLDLDDSAYNRKLREDQARARQAESSPGRIRLGVSSQEASQFRRQMQQLDQQLTRDAIQRASSGQGSILATLLGMSSPSAGRAQATQQTQAQRSFLSRLTGGGSGGGGGISIRLPTGGGGGGGGGNQGLGTGLFKGIGPGVLGIGTRTAGIIAGGASALGALPAAGALGAGLGVLGLGAGVLFGGKNNPLGAQLKDELKQAEAIVKSAAQPLVKPIEDAVRGLGAFFRQIKPELHDLFAAAAPLLKPLTAGLESLIKGLLPGLVTILRAAQPVFSVFAKFLGQLGSDLGKSLSIMAPVLKASSVIFGSLLSVLAGLFPVVARLAAIFATALAPVFKDLAVIIKSLMPVLVIVGGIIGDLAKAILGDLVSAFGAVAKLLVAISPSLQMFAKALGQAFQVLENSGVFATLGDALEQVVPLLANLINLLLKQLAPFLPTLIGVFGQLSSAMITLFAAGLSTILKGVTALLTHFPILTKLLAAAAAAWVVFDIAASANPIGLIVIAIVAVIGAITLLVTHWKQVWGDIKQWAADAWNFIYHGFGKFLLPLLGPAGLIALGAIELAQHWHTIWADIMGVVTTVVHFFTTAWNDIFNAIKTAWNAIASFFTSWWNKEVAGWRIIIGAVENIFSAAWNSVSSTIKTAWNAIASFFHTWWSTTSSLFSTTVRAIESLLSAGWNSVYSTIKSAWGTILNFFKGVPGTIEGYFKGALNFLYTAGKDVVQGLWNGMLFIWDKVKSFISGIAGWIKSHKGPLSLDSKLLEPAGRALMSGLHTGLTSGFSIISDFISGVASRIVSGMTGPLSGSAAVAQAFARSILPRGWSWPALQALWNRESGWNAYAVNPSSGAYGIPQSLGHGHPYNLGDYKAQIAWGLNYIAGRYGSSQNAWAHEAQFGWYDRGGWLQPTSIPVNLTGQPEAVLNPAQSQAFLALARSVSGGGGGGSSPIENRLDMLIGRIDQLITETRRGASRTGTAMGVVLNRTARGAVAEGWSR